MAEHQNVPEGHVNEELEKNKSLRYFHGEAGSEGVQEAANGYAAASLIAAGAGNSVVAMLSMINNFVAALLYIKVPTVIQKMGSRKKAVVTLAFIDAISWLPIILLFFFFWPVNPLWLIPCWIINLIPGMICAPARSSWLVDIVPAATRGRYFGIRSAISGSAYIGTFYIIGYVLQLFNGSILHGFGVIFLIAFIATSISFLLYSRIHNTPVTPEKDTNFGFFDFLIETRKRNLGKFILFVSMFQFTVYIASPFFIPYMLNDLHLNYMLFALVFSSEFLAKVIIVTFWGRYADKVGNLKIMKVVSLAIPFIPLLWLVSPNVGFLVLVQLFSGICWAGFDLCSGNFIYEAAPLGKRLKYIAYSKALTTGFMAMGALIGAYLLGIVRPVLGYNILALFVLSGVLRLAVTMVMFPKLKEVRGTMWSHLEQPVLVTAIEPTVMHRQALLHQPNEWIRFGQPQPITIPVEAEIADSRGLFYRQREWPMFAKPSKSQSEAATNTRGLYYQPRGWMPSDVTESTPTESQTQSEKVAANWGLFYRRGEWSMFGRPQTPEASYTSTQPGIETAASRRGLFHRAQGLFSSDKPASTEKNATKLGRLQPAPVLA